MVKCQSQLFFSCPKLPWSETFRLSAAVLSHRGSRFLFIMVTSTPYVLLHPSQTPDRHLLRLLSNQSSPSIHECYSPEPPLVLDPQAQVSPCWHQSLTLVLSSITAVSESVISSSPSPSSFLSLFVPSFVDPLLLYYP